MIQRLDKFISNTKNISRKDTVKAIKKGTVKVNEKTVTDPSFKIDVTKDIIFYNTQKLIYKEHYHIMLNKPQGYITATKDMKEKTVLDLIGNEIPKKNLCPAGRLDKDTEGFVFLTTDGKLAHNVTGPKNHVEKKYYVETDGNIEEEFKKIFENGVTLEDGTLCKSANLEIISQKSCYLTITEGKYHQVKRMFNSVDRNVTFLKRMSIGKVELDPTLLLGEYRELTQDEVEKICLKK